MTESEKDVLRKIEKVLDLPPGELKLESQSTDHDSWDSMGLLGILSMLDSAHGLKVKPGDASRLMTVEGILAVLREAGKLN